MVIGKVEHVHLIDRVIILCCVVVLSRKNSKIEKVHAMLDTTKVFILLYNTTKVCNTCTHTDAYTDAHTHTQTHTQMHTHRRVHRCTHTDAYTDAHIHTHTEIFIIYIFQVQTELRSVKEERELLRQQLESKIQTLQQLEGIKMEYEL